MSENLENHGVEVTAARSVEDDVLVVFIDTPGLDENEKGPVMRIYLNDDPVYENPEYPGERDKDTRTPVAKYPTFASMSWAPGDVTSLEDWNEEWGEEEAEQFLEDNGKLLRDQLVTNGFEIMSTLLAGWKPENPDG